MAKVFEDEFMDIQSDMVSLALEALETAGATVDKIYIYAFGTRSQVFFNLFFRKDGKVLLNYQVGIPDDVVGQVIDFGIEDIEKLREVCERYGRQAPCELKLVYDCASGHFDGDYSYDDLEKSRLSPADVFEKWAKAIGRGADNWKKFFSVFARMFRRS